MVKYAPKSKKQFTILSISLIIFTLGILLFTRAGSYLVRADSFKHGDAMVLLMGNWPERLLHANDLYSAGVSGSLLLVEEDNGALKWLNEKGIALESTSQQCFRAAIALGIPHYRINLLPGDAQSTQMEAIVARKFLYKCSGIDTLIVVSSPSHTRRAGMIFEEAIKSLDRKVLLYTSPSPYSDFTGEKWWNDREDIQIVVMEYLKIFNFLVFEQWEL